MAHHRRVSSSSPHFASVHLPLPTQVNQSIHPTIHPAIHPSNHPASQPTSPSPRSFGAGARREKQQTLSARPKSAQAALLVVLATWRWPRPGSSLTFASCRNLYITSYRNIRLSTSVRYYQYHHQHPTDISVSVLRGRIHVACVAIQPSQQLSKRPLRALRRQIPSTIYKRLPWPTLLPIVVCGADECASLRLVFVAFSPACCCSTSDPSWPRALPVTRWWQPRPRSSDSCSSIYPRKLSERSSHTYGSLVRFSFYSPVMTQKLSMHSILTCLSCHLVLTKRSDMPRSRLSPLP